MARKNNIVLTDDKGRLYIRTKNGMILRPVVKNTHKHYGETPNDQRWFNQNILRGCTAIFSPDQTTLKVGDIVDAKAGQSDDLGTVKFNGKVEYWWVYWNLESIDLKPYSSSS